MPLTELGRKIMRSMKRKHGKKGGKRVFFASLNAGKIPKRVERRS